jgi:hypothetical protein
MADGPRIRREKKTVDAMIRLYCCKHHGTHDDELCPDCKELHEYAMLRLSKCPFQENKSNLWQMFSSLLQTGHESEDSEGYAVFWTPNAVTSSDSCVASCP